MTKTVDTGIMKIEDPSVRLLAAIARRAILDLRVPRKPSEVREVDWPDVQASAREFVELNVPSAFDYI